MNIFKQTKDNVTTRQAAEAYGVKVNRSGMARCPFYNDKHPSMKVDKYFYCFACGAKGDVIHFVEKFFGITPYEAATKLANDFNIPIKNKSNKSKVNSKKKTIQKKKSYQLIQEFEKWEKYCIRILSEYLHLLNEWKLQYAPRYLEDEWKDEFLEACNRREIMEYYLDILLNGELDERIEFVKNKGEGCILTQDRKVLNRIRRNIILLARITKKTSSCVQSATGLAI